MGFTWSLYFAQRVGESLMRKVPSLRNSVILRDRGLPAVIRPGEPDKLLHYVYVDNLCILSTERGVTATALSEATELFDSQGLTTQEKFVSSGCAEALGVEHDGNLKNNPGQLEAS